MLSVEQDIEPTIFQNLHITFKSLQKSHYLDEMVEEELLQHTHELNYHLNTRYPDCWHETYPDIPADHYEENVAEAAKKRAESVLGIVKSVINYYYTH